MALFSVFDRRKEPEDDPSDDESFVATHDDEVTSLILIRLNLITVTIVMTRTAD